MIDDREAFVSPYLTETPVLSLGARIRRLEEEANALMEQRLRYDPAGHAYDRAKYLYCLKRAVDLYEAAMRLREGL